MGGQGSGRLRQFPLEFDECKEAIELYKQRTEQGLIEIPSIPHFLGEIGSYLEEYFDVINEPNDKNIPLSVMLKKFGNWCDAEAIKRSDKLKALTAVLLAQGFGGYKYQTKDNSNKDMKAEITVKFDGNISNPFD